MGEFVVLDFETTGFNPYKGDRPFCWAYITEKGEKGFMLKTQEGIEWLKSLFADPTKKIIFHNAKFDLKMAFFEGIDIFYCAAEIHDTFLLAKVFNSMLFSHELEWLGEKLCGRPTADKTEITQYIKARQKAFVKEHGRKMGFHDVPTDIVKRRALWDVETTLILFQRLWPRVMRSSPDLYRTEQELLFVTIEMENSGVEVDITKARELKAECEAGAARLKTDLDALVCPFTIIKKKKRKRQGETYIEEIPIEVTSFNTNSPPQKVAVFQKMGFVLKYKTKPKKGKKGGKPTGGGNWCFDEYAMMRYSDPQITAILRMSGEESWTLDKFYNAVKEAIEKYDLDERQLLPAFILKANEQLKLISTYYDHLIEDCVDVHFRPDGREIGVLHCKFNQAEAMTGRFSSSQPNLQNLPRLLGPRQCFIPRKARRHWHFDYEQVEMKFFVHFAKDKDMAKAIEGDIHLFVASQIYGVPIDKVTKEQRKRAKGVNFGIIYGSGAATMAEAMTMKGLPTSKSEAAKIVANYHRRFPSVRRTTNQFERSLVRQKYVENPFQRRYFIPTKYAYKALNYMCQGTSADLMKKAMVRIWKWLKANGLKSRILMQVHDELVLEVPQNEEHLVYSNVKRLMEDRESFFIPITVDADVVKRRWSQKYSMKELGLEHWN